MKRKVIQIANSTQLISLPRKWTLKYGVKKGDELEVEEDGSKVIISTEKGFETEKVELDVTALGVMTQRCVHALYKKGTDEIKLTFNHPELIESVQSALGKEAVGFEITEQGSNYCVIKHISGELQDFDLVLRRTFLILISMADSSLDAIKKGNFSTLRSTALLEEANNRFTTSCRRFINKMGYKDTRKTGSIYYIIEDMENLADHYKYICDYLYKIKDNNIKVGKETIEIYTKVNEMLRNFYELFYKFDKKKLGAIAESRKDIVQRAYTLFEKNKRPIDIIITHNLLIIMQKIFCFLGPYLVMTL